MNASDASHGSQWRQVVDAHACTHDAPASPTAYLAHIHKTLFESSRRELSNGCHGLHSYALDERFPLGAVVPCPLQMSVTDVYTHAHDTRVLACTLCDGTKDGRAEGLATDP